MPTDPQPSQDLRARVLAAVAQAPAETRTKHTWQTRVSYVVALAFGLAFFEWMGGAEHGAGRPWNLTVVIAAGSLLLSVVVAWVALRRGKSMLGRTRLAYIAAAMLPPGLTFVWLHSFYGQYVEPFQRVGWRCLGMTLAIAGGVFAAGVYNSRRTVVRDANWRGAAMGAASATWASVLVDLWCPLTNTAHLMFGHVLPVVLVIALGAALGAPVLAIRPNQPRRA